MFPLRRPALREGASGDAGSAKEPRWPQLEGRAAVENRDVDEEEEEAAAKDDEDDDGDLVIATALRGAVVDAAALDRARAWSMLLEDISRWKSSARASERERESVRYS